MSDGNSADGCSQFGVVTSVANTNALTGLDSNITGPSRHVIVAALLVGAALFLGLHYFGLQLDLALLVVFSATVILSSSALGKYRVVFVLVVAVMTINLANYTFLAYDAEGNEISSPLLRFVALLRLPIVVIMVAWVSRLYGSDFLFYLRQNWDVLLLVLIPFVSCFFAVDLEVALSYSTWFLFSLLAVLAFLFALARHVPAWLWTEHIAWLFLATNLMMVFFGIAGVQEMLSLGGSSPYARTLFAETNIHAVSCAVVIAAILALDRHRSSRQCSRFLFRVPQLLLVAIGAAASVPLLLSAKRSAIVSVVLVAAVYFRGSTTGARSMTRMARAAMIVGTLAIVTWSLLPMATGTFERFEKALDPDRNTSIQDRVSIVEASTSIILKYPFFGVGLANGKLATLRYVPASEVAGVGLHNTYLAILVEMGFVGLVIFVVVAVKSFLMWRRLTIYNLKLDLVILGITPLLVSITEATLTPGQALFWPLWISVLFPRILLAHQTRLHLAADDPRRSARRHRPEALASG